MPEHPVSARDDSSSLKDTRYMYSSTTGNADERTTKKILYGPTLQTRRQKKRTSHAEGTGHYVRPAGDAQTRQIAEEAKKNWKENQYSIPGTPTNNKNILQLLTPQTADTQSIGLHYYICISRLRLPEVGHNAPPRFWMIDPLNSRSVPDLFFFLTSLLLSSLTRGRFYPQRASRQAGVTGVHPSPPPYVPLFFVYIRTACTATATLRDASAKI